MVDAGVGQEVLEFLRKHDFFDNKKVSFLKVVFFLGPQTSPEVLPNNNICRSTKHDIPLHRLGYEPVS